MFSLLSPKLSNIVFDSLQEFEDKLVEISHTQGQIETDIEERLVREFQTQMEEQLEAKTIEVEAQKKKVIFCYIGM